MAFFGLILFVYFVIILLLLKKIFFGKLNYIIYYLLLFLPFHTFFQLISLKLTDSTMFVYFFKYSKDFVIFSSFAVYFFGYKGKLKNLNLKFSFLDRLILLFSFITIVYTIIPLGQSNFFSKILYSKNILIISIIYFFGRISSLSNQDWEKVYKGMSFIVVIAFIISFFEFSLGYHLHSFLNYSDYLIQVYDRMPVGNFGLSWTFERNPFQGRFAAFFSDPLEFSASLILFCSFFLFHLYYSKTKFHKSINLLFLFMIFSSFVFAYSRASIISVIIVLIISLILIKKFRLLFRVFIFLTFFSTIVLLNANDEFLYFIQDTLTFKELSSLGHLLEWIEGILTIVENPMGIGLAMSGNASSVDQSIKIGGENQFLIYAVQMGVISLITYLMIIYTSIYHSFQLFYKSNINHVKSLAFVAGLTKLGLIIPLFTANAELYLFVSLFSWFLIGNVETNFLKLKNN